MVQSRHSGFLYLRYLTFYALFRFGKMKCRNSSYNIHPQTIWDLTHSGQADTCTSHRPPKPHWGFQPSSASVFQETEQSCTHSHIVPVTASVTLLRLTPSWGVIYLSLILILRCKVPHDPEHCPSLRRCTRHQLSLTIFK